MLSGRRTVTRTFHERSIQLAFDELFLPLMAGVNVIETSLSDTCAHCAARPERTGTAEIIRCPHQFAGTRNALRIPTRCNIINC